MKNKLVILLFSIFAIVTCQAAVITATVTSKTEADVTGDETGIIGASFETTSSAKDRITEGKTAQLTLTHLPEGQIDYIAVYMHSNKAGGAGSLSLKLNGVTVASVADKKFSDWPGQTAFSTDYVKVWFSGPWEIGDETTLELTINASANSLYFNQMDVSFAKGAVKPYSVTFYWNTSEGDKQMTITEKAIGAGIVLPDCQQQSLTLDGETWTFVGWTNDRVVAKMNSAPTMWNVGKSYFPVRNTNMFAVYKSEANVLPIMQDTLYQSGMFAMVMLGDAYYMAKGGVISKQISAQPCEVELQADGRYRLMQDYVPANARYWVEFDEQTLTITNVGENVPIGHSTTVLEENTKAWNWSRGLNHSTAMYFSPEIKDGIVSVKLLMPIMQDQTKESSFVAKTVKLIEDFEYILLFDVIDAPTTASSAVWTTHPFGYDAISVVKSNEQSVVKKIMRNGIMLIEKDGVLFDLQGRKYNN